MTGGWGGGGGAAAGVVSARTSTCFSLHTKKATGTSRRQYSQWVAATSRDIIVDLRFMYRCSLCANNTHRGREREIERARASFSWLGAHDMRHSRSDRLPGQASININCIVVWNTAIIHLHGVPSLILCLSSSSFKKKSEHQTTRYANKTKRWAGVKKAKQRTRQRGVTRRSDAAHNTQRSPPRTCTSWQHTGHLTCHIGQVSRCFRLSVRVPIHSQPSARSTHPTGARGHTWYHECQQRIRNKPANKKTHTS